MSGRSTMSARRGRRGHGDGDGQAGIERRRRDLRPDQHARAAARAARRCSAACDKVVRSVGSVGHATFGHTAIARWFDPKRHQRVVIFTDDQQHDSGHVRLDHVPLIYTFNLAGYRPSALPAGERGRYTLGGFTDATFTVDEGARGRPQRDVAVLRYDGLRHIGHLVPVCRRSDGRTRASVGLRRCDAISARDPQLGCLRRR